MGITLFHCAISAVTTSARRILKHYCNCTSLIYIGKLLIISLPFIKTRQGRVLMAILYAPFIYIFNICKRQALLANIAIRNPGIVQYYLTFKNIRKQVIIRENKRSLF